MSAYRIARFAANASAFANGSVLYVLWSVYAVPVGFCVFVFLVSMVAMLANYIEGKTE